MTDEVNEEVKNEQHDVGKLTEIYIKIRDKRASHKRAFEELDANLADQQDVVSAKLLDTCKELNADSIRTPHGTVIRSTKSRYWTNDWDSMYDFIDEHGAFGLLEKRLHQTNMKDFIADNPMLFPKGMNVESEYTVIVRRSKS